MRAWCNDATMLEQIESVPGSCNIRYGASTKKLDEIGLMRMPCHAVEVVIPGAHVANEQDPPPRMRSKRLHIAHTEQQMMMDT